MKVVMLDPSCLTWVYTHRLCETLPKRGCQVHLVASRFPYANQENVASYQQWNHFYNRTTRLYRGKTQGFLRQYVKGAEHITDMFRLPGFLRTLKPNIIHFQQAPIPCVDRWFLGSLRRIAPLVSTVHNTTPFHGEASRLQRWGFGSFLSQFDHLIVHTEYSRRQLIEGLGIASDRLSVLPIGLYGHYEGVARKEPTQLTIRETDGEQVVLFFGNISHYKGLDVLIHALAQLPKECLRNTRLLVAGNPQIPIEPIKVLAKEAGIEDNVEWDLRFIPEEQVHSVFERATVLALPYRHIDGSGVLATALRYGKPIVASHIGGFAELLEDGVHGYLVEPENPSALAAGLENILSNASRAQAMSGAVRKLAQGWCSWDAIAEQTIGIYQDLSNRWLNMAAQ